MSVPGTRRDGAIERYGVTTFDEVVWRIGIGPVRETKRKAALAAAGRVNNTETGETPLGHERVNVSDLIALLAEFDALDKGKTGHLCFSCHAAPSYITPGGKDVGTCFNCYSNEKGDR